MEDRYLFKAQRLDSEEWVEGALVYDNKDELYRIITEIDYSTGTCVTTEKAPRIERFTACQCTGLKDKNGKLIWEGDIILFQLDNDDCPFPNKDTKKRLGKVFYKGFRTTFAIGMGKNGSSSINDDLWKYVQNGNRVEVIGNVFDNAELLENEGQHGRKEL